MKILAKKSKKPEPKKERELPKYKRNSRWVMLVEYRDDLVNRKLQKFEFKIEKGGIRTATKEAERLARIIGKGVAETIKEIEEDTLCRVVAVYSENVFESWQKEVGIKTNAHIKDIVKQVKAAKDKNIQKVKKIGVR